MNAVIPEDHELRLHVERRSDMDALLDHAVEFLLGFARVYGDRGIRIVRHSAHGFTVKLDRQVPYGTCYEEQVW